jgi:eukaryotic-like serine/threonine-protein kinase
MVVRVGDMIDGKYCVEREIGRGGMGVVYRALHVDLDQRVALKFLRQSAAQNPEIVERFRREARAAVKIQSEHVARVMDIGRLEGDLPYIVMELLEGEDLESVIKANGPLPVEDAIRHVVHTCEALAEVHVQGIVHRDIKPANLFLAKRADGTYSVKLLDFGISKAAATWTDAEPSLTNTNAIIGSPNYMSPEQLRSSRDVDERSDVWALGVTLYELLGARHPFACGTLPEVCAAILKDEPGSLCTLRDEISPALDAVIRRCLEKDADKRWANVAELAIALRPFGPLGIVDISVERIVGVLQQRASADVERPPEPTVRVATRDSVTAPATAVLGTSDGVGGVGEAEIVRALLERLGGRGKVPYLTVELGAITNMNLDHRTGFMLSQIVGTTTIDELLDVSGMARDETLQLLIDLVDRGLVNLR